MNYIALIEPITSPPVCKLFYCAEMPQFLQAVGSNGLPQHTQFLYAFARFSRFGNHCWYVPFRKFHCLANCYQFRTSFWFTFREELPIRQGIRFHSCVQRSSRRWLWCMRSPCRSCDRSRQSCYPSQVTLRPRCFSSSELSSYFAEVLQKLITRLCPSSRKF